MKKTKYLIITLLISSVILTYFYNSNKITTRASSDDTNSMLYLIMNDTSTDPATIYSEKYQNKIKQQIDNAKQKYDYTFKAPLLIENPYGTNTTGKYICILQPMKTIKQLIQLIVMVTKILHKH